MQDKICLGYYLTICDFVTMYAWDKHDVILRQREEVDDLASISRRKRVA